MLAVSCCHLLRDQVENDRLFQLGAKLSLLTERPEHRKDARWKEGGEYYPLRLLVDYVFHQHWEDDGTPNVSMSHVVNALNKVRFVPLFSGLRVTMCVCSLIPDRQS